MAVPVCSPGNLQDINLKSLTLFKTLLVKVAFFLMPPAGFLLGASRHLHIYQNESDIFT
ncbi:hypothetical protein NCZ15_17990 [Phocaeicola vulgatus]|nr:hypothetical protein [Phocaeicola vulgatus]MCM1862520.1 hypothetical protein [Phocaeicola vulgatus]